jgi:thiamine pyrophosphate-dependent acetolactate synthase large subunit-like protein
MGTVTRLGDQGEGVSVSQHKSDQLDEALKETFPASDPIAIDVRTPKPEGQASQIGEKKRD